MRKLSLTAGVAALVFLAYTAAYAGDGHGKPAATTHGPSKTVQGPSTSHGPSAHGTTTHSDHSTTSKKGSTPTTKTTKKTSTSTTGTSNTSTTTSSTGTTNTGSTTTEPLSPIAQKIQSKPNLSARLSAMLPIDPATGQRMTMNKAALGFKNQGQFIAALHVSQNLGIKFTDLKAKMLGTAGTTGTGGTTGATTTATTSPKSLGQSIQALKGSVDANAAVREAETQTEHDLTAPTGTTTTGTTTSKKPSARK